MPTITPPFQRRITNPLQRPLSSDLNLQAFYDSVTQAYLAGAVYSASPGGNPTFDTGFVGNSFRCFASTTSREVVVQKGLGFINAATAYDEDDINGIAGVNAGSYAPVVCQPSDPDAAGLYVAVADLAAGLSRIDLVCVKAPNYPTATANIGLLNPTSSTFAFAPRPTQFTENAFSVTSGDPDFIQVVTGAPIAGTPTAPAVPSGYLEIGRIYVPVGSSALSNSDIEDRRNVLIPHGGRAMTLNFSTYLGQGGNPDETVGFQFGNNGVHAIARASFSTPPTGGKKTFEVYVSSASTNPLSFDLTADGVTQTNDGSSGVYNAIFCSVISKTTVSRSSALPYFQEVGGTQAILGPTVAKFVVVAGPARIPAGEDWVKIDTRADYVNANGIGTIRCGLYAQAF